MTRDIHDKAKEQREHLPTCGAEPETRTKTKIDARETVEDQIKTKDKHVT